MGIAHLHLPECLSALQKQTSKTIVPTQFPHSLETSTRRSTTEMYLCEISKMKVKLNLPAANYSME
jgi:hypothetical protein